MPFPVNFVRGFIRSPGEPPELDPAVWDEVDAAVAAQGYGSLVEFQRAHGLSEGLTPETLDALGVELR
jgi:hypothetical protein